MKIFRTVLILLCFATPSRVGAQDGKWIRSSSEHFFLVTDTTDVKAQRLLTDLEQRVAGFSDIFGKLRPRQFPIEVFLLKNREDFIAAMPKLPPVNGNPPPEKNGYLMAGPDRFFILAKDKSAEDIANDAGHALGHVLFEHQVLWRPFWLAEGIAEYVRKMGRDADTKAVPEKDGFSVDDLLTIVPSATYQDGDPGGAFRTQSYRLLRLVLYENPQALREFIAALGREDGADAKLNIDIADITSKVEEYVESPLKLSPVAPAVETTPIDAASLAIHRGDLLMATDRTSEASRYYNANSQEARAARAVVTRVSRLPAEALQSLAMAARDLPDNGLVQYHFGSLATENPKMLEAQVAALEKAVALLPSLGRAHGELARVYALTGKADRALPFADRAIQLEPEFADHFYDIRADVLFRLQQPEEALRTIKLADALPHADRKTVEAYSFKVAGMAKRIENARREADAQHLARIRRDLETKVNEREPVQPPKPVIPVREGQIDYQITASSPVEVVDSVYPEYPEALRKLEKAGRIVLRLEVGPDGKVKNAAATSSQIPELNAATIEAARKWTFKLPARARPTPATVTITFIYALQ